MSVLKKILFFSSIIAFIIIISLFFSFTKNFNKEQIVEIPFGSSKLKVFSILEKNKAIHNAKLHYFSLKIIEIFKRNIVFKSGEYLISKDDDYISLLKKIIIADNYLRKFTIPEGYSTAQAIEVLKENPYLSGEITSIPAEGTLLPETYFFNKGDSRQKQIDIMKNNMSIFLDKAWKTRNINIPLKNKQEMLILASIVEKETGINTERARVAGVFINRLNRGMRLQSDPTVIYAITLGKYKLDRQLSKRNLRINSPYNTYVIKALPIKPIANPGKEALIAVANPKKTNELYFVSDGNGQHRFSKNLIEHNRNVKKLRKFEKNSKKINNNK